MKKNQLFYSSSADRGLYELLEMFPLIKKNVPDVSLKICYGFETWELAIKQRNNKDELEYMHQIQELMKQPGVTNCGRVSKQELADIQLESKVWAFPTAFWETFCITAVESGLANCAIVTTKLAGLESTVGTGGILIEGDNKSKGYQNIFINEVTKLLLDDVYWSTWSKRAAAQMSQFTIEKCGKFWQELFHPSSIKLNLGAGDARYKDYLSCDCFEAPFIDKVFDICNPPYEKETVSAIYSSHCLEHNGWLEVDTALQNWYRILKHGGELILRMPDLKLCCLNYIATGELWYKWTLYGVQKSQKGEPDLAQYHKTGFSKEEMKTKLETLGFKITKCENYDGFKTPSLEIVANK